MSNRAGRSRRSRAHRCFALVAAFAAALLPVALVPLSQPVHAATTPEATFVDLEPESVAVAPGATVTLEASVYDQDRNLFAGPGTSTHVRFYFTAASPNTPDSPGNSPDVSCHTGTSGRCTISYVAAKPGTDVICARFSGPPSLCDEAINAPELDNSADVVERIISSAEAPTPTPVSPTPTPTPTPVAPDPTPTPEPTPTAPPDVAPDVAPHATPTPTPDPTPSPTPVPTATPTPDPIPTPTPVPTPSPTPVPTPTPTPIATPTPTPVATPTPTPVATPTPTPVATPDPTPTPTPVPTPVATPDPTPEPSAEPTPSTPPDPTPDATPDPTPSAAPSPLGGQGGPFNPIPTDGPTASPVPITAAGGAPQGSTRPPTETTGLVPLVPASGPRALVDAVLSGAVSQLGLVVQPQAATAVAATFGFPMALMIATLLFLLAQSRLDHRDPKLRVAPRSGTETIVPFTEESQL